jgi:lipoprotein-releasing system permease protein
MYKLLLSLRYLRTRWIALASIISVTLGVATLIVVNSVMGGFATEMRSRVKGVLADIMIKAGGLAGFPNSSVHIDRVIEVAGDQIDAVSPVIESFGLLTFQVRGRSVPQPVRVIAADPKTLGKVSKFPQYLVNVENQADPSFEIRESVRRRMEPWRAWRDVDLEGEAVSGQPSAVSEEMQSVGPAEPFDPAARTMRDDAGSPASAMTDPFAEQGEGSLVGFDPTVRPKDRGIVVPWLLATDRSEGQDYEVIRQGDEVVLTLPSASVGSFRVEGKHAAFTVVDRFKSGMSEYDQMNCYVDIADFRELMGMPDRATAILIKLKNYADARAVVERLERVFPPGLFTVRTWEEEQGPLLSAVAVEQGILNVLLFMIIAVAGFGILAIFFMIVVEKMRDIGVLKSLGASDGGVQQIFLMYGLGLGTVGSGLGLAIGLAIVVWLDTIERGLSWLMGHDVFSRDLYYFDRIPRVVDAANIAWIVVGALLIAVAASVLPARRAAALRPVQALRYE